MLTQQIRDAVEELQQTFEGALIRVEADGSGGAWVTIDPIELGPNFEQSTTWIAFQITFPYPEADIYPLFVRPDLSLSDGRPLGEGFQTVTWGPQAAPGVQLSRRSNRLDPSVDTAATKVIKVLRWLAEQ